MGQDQRINETMKQGIGDHGSAQQFLSESMEQAQWFNDRSNELMDHWINDSESMDQWLNETQNHFHKSTRQCMRNYARNELLDQCLNESMKPDAINQWIRINDPIWSIVHELVKRWIRINGSANQWSMIHSSEHHLTQGPLAPCIRISDAMNQ